MSSTSCIEIVFPLFLKIKIRILNYTKRLLNYAISSSMTHFHFEKKKKAVLDMHVYNIFALDPQFSKGDLSYLAPPLIWLAVRHVCMEHLKSIIRFKCYTMKKTKTKNKTRTLLKRVTSSWKWACQLSLMWYVQQIFFRTEMCSPVKTLYWHIRSSVAFVKISRSFQKICALLGWWVRARMRSNFAALWND